MKFLTPEQLYEIFYNNVDISFMTVELKKEILKALDAVYTKGLEDCRTLHLGERV